MQETTTLHGADRQGWRACFYKQCELLLKRFPHLVPTSSTSTFVTPAAITSGVAKAASTLELQSGITDRGCACGCPSFDGCSTCCIQHNECMRRPVSSVKRCARDKAMLLFPAFPLGDEESKVLGYNQSFPMSLSNHSTLFTLGLAGFKPPLCLSIGLSCNDK